MHLRVDRDGKTLGTLSVAGGQVRATGAAVLSDLAAEASLGLPLAMDVEHEASRTLGNVLVKPAHKLFWIALRDWLSAKGYVVVNEDAPELNELRELVQWASQVKKSPDLLESLQQVLRDGTPYEQSVLLATLRRARSQYQKE